VRGCINDVLILSYAAYTGGGGGGCFGAGSRGLVFETGGLRHDVIRLAGKQRRASRSGKRRTPTPRR